MKCTRLKTTKRRNCSQPGSGPRGRSLTATTPLELEHEWNRRPGISGDRRVHGELLSRA